MLDDKASKTYNCDTCTSSLKKIRNCDDNYEPVKLWINKKIYQQCPVSIYWKDLELKQMVNMYMHARNSKTLFVKEALNEQTNWYYEFSSLIESKITQSQNNQMDEMKKDTDKKANQAKSKGKGKRR